MQSLSSTLCFFLSDRPVVQFPDDHPKNLTLEKGATATFFCKTIGNPATTAQRWQFKGIDISGDSCAGCSTTTTTLTKAAVTESDAGWYSCIGTNILGDGPPARAQLLIKRKYKVIGCQTRTWQTIRILLIRKNFKLEWYALRRVPTFVPAL